MDMSKVIINVEKVSKTFVPDGGGELRVLDDVSLVLREGEIVALLGKSGSGKSTLLRIIAGLIPPSSGEIKYRGQLVRQANPGVSMVFQSFALLPWLTVLENVELSLRAKGVPPDQRRRRALEAIDIIGLDGFEGAYPKELSGGMRQRVGFARALVGEPDALLMDEPFSALDVLTAENLRREIVGLWGKSDFPTRSVLIVTHNIDEAVQLADRVVVMGSNPGRIMCEVPIHLSRPRERDSTAFRMLVAQLYALLAGQSDEIGETNQIVPLVPIPPASVGGMAGLVEILAASQGSISLPELAHQLSFEVDDLLPLVDAAHLLGFIEIDGQTISLTAVGRRWCNADILSSKEIFANALTSVPLVKSITTALNRSESGWVHIDFFKDVLKRHLPAPEVESQLNRAIEWARYGELFEYDADTGHLELNS